MWGIDLFLMFVLNKLVIFSVSNVAPFRCHDITHEVNHWLTLWGYLQGNRWREIFNGNVPICKLLYRKLDLFFSGVSSSLVAGAGKKKVAWLGDLPFVDSESGFCFDLKLSKNSTFFNWNYDLESPPQALFYHVGEYSRCKVTSLKDLLNCLYCYQMSIYGDKGT